MLRTTKFWFLVMPAALSAGILIGSFMAARMPAADTEAFFETVQRNLSVESLAKSSFLNAFLQSGKTAALLFIFGTTVIGAVPSAILLSVRGYAIGMSVGTLLRQFGLRGFFAALGGVFPHSIFYLPCLLLMATQSAKSALRLLKKEASGQFLQYVLIFLILFVFLLFGALVEGYISAPLLKRILYHAL